MLAHSVCSMGSKCATEPSNGRSQATEGHKWRGECCSVQRAL